MKKTQPKASRKRMSPILRIILIILAVIVVVACAIGIRMLININSGSYKLDARLPTVSDDPKVLNVAFYPYAPNMPLMEQLAIKMFKEIEPDVTLNIVDWDCYLSNSPDNIDVFMYDSLFMNSLYENGYLSELDISGFEDVDQIADFAINETTINVNGRDVCFGVPNLLCSDFLIYRDGDTDIAKCENINDLYDVIGLSEYGKNTGLLANFLNNYPYFYINAVVDNADESKRDVYAQIETGDEKAKDTIRKFSDMIGKKEAKQSLISRWLRGEYDKPALFAEGYGRAFYGYSEYMSQMQKVIDKINIKLISLNDGPDQAMFYADLLSINASVTNPEKRSYCEELVELLSSHDYIYEVGLNDGTPAYLLPARLSMLDEFAEKYPMYYELKEVLNAADMHIACYGSWVFDYTNNLYSELSPLIN